MNISQLLNLPSISFTQFVKKENTLEIYATIKRKTAKCPKCGCSSRSVHGTYLRTIRDLSSLEFATTIKLKIRKFKCKNENCARVVFSEQPSFSNRYSRLTNRATKLLHTLSLEVTGRLCSFLSKKINIEISPSTALRAIHKQSIPKFHAPRVVGVDDWAFRKGKNYGTIIVDMETSQPLDLLATRESKDLKQWLSDNNAAEIYTRDRSSAYSSAIKEMCPDSIQVADRFHLTMNLTDALDTFFKCNSSKIKAVVEQNIEKLQNSQKIEGVEKEIDVDDIVETKSCQCKDDRLVIFEEVKTLQNQGFSIRKIANELGISRKRVNNYFHYDSLPPRVVTKSTNFDKFSTLVISKLGQQNYVVKEIIEEIKQLGYNGSQTQAYENINRLKRYHGLNKSANTVIQKKKIPYIKHLTSKELTKMIGVSLNTIESPEIKNYMKILLDKIPKLKVVKKLVQIFKTMIWRKKGNIDRWITLIQNSKYKLPGLLSLANGMKQDIDAVRNALNMDWNNGMVEGHVNRIKTIKRQMYGRASFELLRRKVILSQFG